MSFQSPGSAEAALLFECVMQYSDEGEQVNFGHLPAWLARQVEFHGPILGEWMRKMMSLPSARFLSSGEWTRAWQPSDLSSKNTSIDGRTLVPIRGNRTGSVHTISAPPCRSSIFKLSTIQY